MTLRPFQRATALFLLVALIRCGGGAAAPVCSGSSCVCNTGGACDLGGSACDGTSCSLKCASQTECSGTCGESCSLDCDSQSTCTLTLGKSGSVTCAGGSTCHITCTAACSVSCSGGATCDLTCSGAGETEAKSIPQGGKCET